MVIYNDIMRNKLIYIYIAAALALTHAGCAKKPAEASKVLARVSNKTITLGEFKSRVSRLPAYYQDIVNRNKKRFLDEIIVEMMFYEEAIRKGVDREKEVHDILAEARKKILIAKLIKEEVEDKIKVDETEARKFYEEHKDEFKTQELWRASHILVATQEEAKEILAELSKGATFEELAKSRSTDATASRGGDVGYFRAGQVVPDFEKVCFKLKVGETSDIVRTQFGYHIIKLTDKKEPAVEPFEKTRHIIEDRLRKKKRSELFDKLVLDLKNKYKAKIEEDIFQSLEKTGND